VKRITEVALGVLIVYHKGTKFTKIRTELLRI
jgi:hypothetical protein